MRQKSPKKSETIEIRVSYATKAAFVARCRGEGCTVSEALRQFMTRESDAPSGLKRGRGRIGQAVAAALAGIALGAVAAPSLAHPAGNSRAAFERLDRNHDGLLTFEEFRRG